MMAASRMRSVLIAMLTAGELAAGSGLALDLGKILDLAPDLAAAGGLNEKDEIAVGREIAGRVLGTAPLTRDPELQSYVNRVGRWIAAQSERPDLPWHFGVIETSDVNAFASPGGYVLITRGLYEMLDSEAQLAGVLGHEISHIVKRHHVTVMQKSAAISAGSKLARAQSRSEFLGTLIGNGAEVFARGLDKSAEYEADVIGVVLAARAGYSPYGLVEVLHKLAARAGDDSALALLFKTHPHPDERLTHLGDALTPRVASLPAGAEPQLRAIDADAVAQPATRPAPPSGAKPLKEEEAAPTVRPGQRGIGVDPGGILRGIFGR